LASTERLHSRRREARGVLPAKLKEEGTPNSENDCKGKKEKKKEITHAGGPKPPPQKRSVDEERKRDEQKKLPGLTEKKLRFQKGKESLTGREKRIDQTE